MERFGANHRSFEVNEPIPKNFIWIVKALKNKKELRGVWNSSPLFCNISLI